MERMVYQAPDGSLVIEPTAHQLAEIISRSEPGYWLRGTGEAAIRVAKRFGDGRGVSHTVHTPDGTKVAYAAGEPELWIKQPEAGQFFFTWNGADWMIPYDGSGCETFVMDERGGNPFKIPRACLVDATKALDIACHFLESRGRSPVVNWAYWSDLPLPEDWE